MKGYNTEDHVEPKAKPERGHILVDLDRTLATYDSYETSGKMIGKPIPPMLERVKRWIKDGITVKIFTARAASTNPDREEDIIRVKMWVAEHVGAELAVTAEKDFKCVAIVDDLAVSVEANTGVMLIDWDGDSITEEEEIRLINGQPLETKEDKKTVLWSGASLNGKKYAEMTPQEQADFEEAYCGGYGHYSD